ncbi:nucleotidyl transferase AbiEii/AbiGii toxin family protein [Rhodococcus sp. NPDC056960]|uniref:nucleotidyl transferase AbiEii/AbiGii toxin family protein n=1 Tax=Rhodococcus sp. NPDC056960 TaxID=3345982 RepID=UPI00363CE0EC
MPDGRLSEDIDLITLDKRRSVLATDLDKALPRALQRSHGRLEWAPPLSAGSSVDAAILHTTSGLSVKIQLLSSTDRPLWPTEPRDLIQRYSDAPPARLLVPTLPAFAASKTATWCDRTAARDLWDLWALNNIGAINPDTAALFRTHGPTGKNPGDYVFRKPPSDNEWQTQLAGQTRLTVTATAALHTVRTAWAHVAPNP